MPEASLLCRVHRAVCALPARQVVETLRPLPIEPLAGAPGFVCGLSLIRGEPVPVVDLGLLLGGEQVRATRFVSLRSGSRRVAVAVSAVLGMRTLDAGAATELPPLLGGAPAHVVQALGSLDRELLLVLESGHLLPDELLQRLDAERARS